MRKGAEILSLHTQDDRPCIWAIVTEEEPELEQRTFVTFGTGQSMMYNKAKYLNDKAYRFIGTYLLDKDKYVFHVFEEV